MAVIRCICRNIVQKFLTVCRSRGQCIAPLVLFVPGVPFYPIRTEEKERTPNEQVLTKLFRISHEYIFGLNSTNLTIGGEHETKNRRGRSHLHRV